MFNGFLEDLVNNLKKLPGIGSKTAQRLAIHLISKEKIDAINLAESVKIATGGFRVGSTCNMLSETDPCRFCEDTTRIPNVLCVVRDRRMPQLPQCLHEFKGKYFVLNELLSPLDGIGPNEINFPQLEKMINAGEINEIILALNPSAEGESTINFLASQFENKDIKITRLSTGLPFGGDIEYTSSITLSNAFKRRYSVTE